MMFGRRRAGTVGLVGFQQILGVGGALTLANVLKDLIFWTDMIRTILGGWAEFVQTWLWPVAAFLFGWVFELLQLELTAFWKDYLTIGLLFAAGFLRHFWLVVRRIDEEADEDLGFDVTIPFPVYMSPALRWAPLILTPLSIVAWPATLVLFAGMMVLSREDVRFVIYGLVSILLPLIYLGLLIALNELVLK
ncbi:hypothetical protein L2D00_13475 [Hyphomonadaceae bacterium BL14]|nr:hypothetical protein L2D00_13475 [Hyphomonadaceae bacterium BL14]